MINVISITKNIFPLLAMTLQTWFFDTKQQNMVRLVQKNVSHWLFFHFQQTLQKITKKMIVFYKKKYFDTLILEKVDPYQKGR